MQQRIAAPRPYFILAGVCALLALAGWWLYLVPGHGHSNPRSWQDINTKVSGMRQYEDRFNSHQRRTLTKLAANAAPLGRDRREAPVLDRA